MFLNNIENMTKDIVLISDDNYFLPTIVCIRSIIDNACLIDGDFVIHVCSFSLLGENINKLRALSTDRINVVVDLFNADDYSDKINQISQKTHVTPTALIKFELPHYFDHLDSLLYLDGDIIVKDNLGSLLSQDVDSYILAATYDFLCHFNRIRYTLHRTVSDEFYFNSGVMLLNLKKMRELNIPDKLWDYKINKSKTKLMDQESLNAVCGYSVLHLPIKFNFNPRFFGAQFVKEINKVYDTDYTNETDLSKDIRIIHYVGHIDKPWIYEDAKMRTYWDDSYGKIEWGDSLALISSSKKKISTMTMIRDKIRNHGIFGTLCYLCYLLRVKRTSKL